MPRGIAAWCASLDSLAGLYRGASLDDLVRPQEQCWRDREAERVRGPAVDDQLELGRPLDRQIARPGALEDPVDVPGRFPEHGHAARAVPEEGARLHVVRGRREGQRQAIA